MTLTELAYYLRRAVPFVVLSGIIVSILFVTVQIIILTRPQTTVTVAPTPTPAFGRLPGITMPHASALPQGVTYIMDTVEGVPLTATSSAHIYFVPKQTPNLGFREKTAVLAKALGFDEDSTVSKLDNANDTYTLVDRSRRLIVDISTFNYIYSQDFDDESTRHLQTASIPQDDLIITKAKDILRSLNRYPPELAQSSEVVSYIRYQEASGSAQASASIVSDPQDANMVGVDFFPPKISGIDTVTEDYVGSANRVVFIPHAREKDFVVKAQVAVFDRSQDQGSPYPLKSGDVAFADLHAGKGYLIHSNSTNREQINIKKMYLAYLIPDTYTPYIQPVYVFVGEDDFVAYVPALDDRWVEAFVPALTRTQIEPTAIVTSTPVPITSPSPTPTVTPTSAESTPVPIPIN